MKKNVAGQAIGAQLVSATDGSAVTTGTTTVYVTGDAGTQAAGSVGSGACTHEGNGYWTYAPAQAETNYDLVAFTFVNSAAVNVTVQVYTTFPQTADAPTAAGIADAVWDEARAGHTSAGSFGQGAASVQGNVTGSVATVTGAVGSVTGAVGSVTGAVGSVTGAVGSVTGNVGGNVVGSVGSVAAGGIVAASFGVGAVDAAALAADAGQEVADAVLLRNLATGSSGTDSLNARTVQSALRAIRNKADIAAGTLTVCKEDDTTTAWTASVTTAAGDPLASVDPA